MGDLIGFLQQNKVKLIIALPGGYLLINSFLGWYKRHNVYKAIKLQRQKCKDAFEQTEEQLKHFALDPKERQRIFELSSSDLQDELQKGHIRAIDVLNVYQTQALEVNERINAVTEPLVDAKALASACDPNSAEKGILFGIPISVKENYGLSGMKTSLGLGTLLARTCSEEAVIVQVIKSQGGIPFVRTNIPQTMMTFESSNPIYGRTNNPFNVKRTSGGSSSGEGALVGCGASIIGLGNDIGGSIRVPCHFCGCYGFKPTAQRLSRKGTHSLSQGQNVVNGSNGPMTRDMEGLVLTMKALLCERHFQLDPEVPPILFRDEMYECTRPLTIGFYLDDGFIQAVPAVQRAVLMAKQALEALGHTVVEFTPPRVDYVIPELYIGSVGGDRNEQFTRPLKDDIIDPVIRDLMLPVRGPKWSTWLLSWFAQILARDSNVGRMLRCRNGKSSVYEWFNHAKNVQNYKFEFYEAWQGKQLDAVICPPFATTAVPHRDVVKIISAGSYSMLYNVLNYPAGVVPVTKVRTDDVTNMKNYPRKRATEKFIHAVTKGSEGLPVGVQCVGLPFKDEHVLRVMRDVRDGLRKIESA